MKSMKETWSLNNGVQIPCLGFGTYKAAEGSTSEIIKTAIRCGYRYLDTASFYETETYACTPPISGFSDGSHGSHS